MTNSGKKGFFAEFKEFISRGNVVDMAVGIIVGGAFTSIVNSLVDDIIMPLVGLILGGVDFAGLSITFRGASICYGSFIQAIVNFLLVALVLFTIVRTMNRFHRKKEEPSPAPAPEPEPSAEEKLLTEIRDLLKK